MTCSCGVQCPARVCQASTAAAALVKEEQVKSKVVTCALGPGPGPVLWWCGACLTFSHGQATSTVHMTLTSGTRQTLAVIETIISNILLNLKKQKTSKFDLQSN